MSTVGMRKRYTTVMEKIIKNAVFESTKVLETVIAELKAEVLRVTNENDNLKIRCSQFEEVVKKRSVYRETGTSPEPWIIEKCDKAVQFDFILHLSDDDDDEPNRSENETQSESSCGPMCEKDPSNDSSSFLKTKDIDDNSDNPLDLSNETMPEKPVADCGKNISESTGLSPQNEQHEVSDTCCETSEIEVQEDVGITHAERTETDQSVLESQESGQNELNEKENLPVQEDVCVSTEMEDVVCERSKAQSEECESSSLLALPTENARSSNESQQALEEMTEMDIEINQQSTLSSELETGDSISADTTDTKFGKNFEPVHAPADDSSPPDQPVTLREEIKIIQSPTQSEQTCTEIDDTAVQSVSTEKSPTKEAQNSSQSKTPPKSQYFLRRQRCSSVTLEDAMLLLDAVSQQKYKSSPPKKSSAKDSSKNVTTPKLVNIPEVTASLGHDSSNSEEIICTAESSQPSSTHSDVTIETVEALELDGSPDNMNIEDQQHQETNRSYKSSWPLETVIDHGVHTSTPIKKSTQVSEADSACLECKDHQEMLSVSTESLSTLVTEKTTPNLSSYNMDESMQAVDTNSANFDIEEQAETATSPAKLSRIEPPMDASVPLVSKTKRNRKTSKQSKLLDMEGIASSDKIALGSQQHNPKFLSAISPIRLSSVSLEGDKSEEFSAPTERGEPALITPGHIFQKDNEGMQVDLTLPIDSSPSSKALAQTISNPILQTPIETIGNVDKISGHPTHDGNEFQEFDHTNTASSTPITSPLLSPPVQHTVVLKLPGDTGDQSSSVGKVITSSSTLSPAQLSAVVSAVRSTQSKTSPTAPSGAIPSGKKGFVAVPFSLQSVMRPHHKIIVIPRQCKVPSSQAVEKDRAIVLKQKSFAAESTTTFISVNLEATSGEGNVIAPVDPQQTTSVTTTTPSVNLEATSGEGDVIDTVDRQQTTSPTTPTVEDTSALTNEPSSSDPVKSPCKNKVQVKLNRIPFPVTSVESVSVVGVPVAESPTAAAPKRRGRPPSKKKKLAIDSSQPTAQPKEDNLPSPMIGPSPQPSGKETTPIQSSLGQNATSTEENQMPTPEQLFPAVAADHSYPQHCMTKSQFLAKLEVSPVVKTSKKADSNEKSAQKASLVDRLRSHLKPHIRTIKKAQNTETGQDGSSLTVETQDPIFTTTTTTITTPQEIPRLDQDEQSGNLPDPIPHNDENKTVTPKTSPAPKNAPNKARVKRKRSPKRNVTPAKPVKTRKLKNTGAIHENTGLPTGRKLSPMRNKIINSNALLSCVRKGIKKKSFLCKFCRKEFGKKKDIEIHIQVHVGKKPFQCNICHRRFSRTMELSRHLKRHNSDKKYQCTSCGKSFIEYNNLKRHTYIHTGEKPYSCPHCSKSFTQSGHMRTHIKNKHKDMED